MNLDECKKQPPVVDKPSDYMDALNKLKYLNLYSWSGVKLRSGVCDHGLWKCYAWFEREGPPTESVCCNTPEEAILDVYRKHQAR